MKYCPSCGKAGVEGLKFCPQCGQNLTGSNFEEKKTHVPKPEAPSKEKKWFERHPGWTLLLVIICSPFALYGVFAALVMLLSLFASSIPSIAAAILTGAMLAMPLAYIGIVIAVVRWYREKRKQSKTIANYGNAIELDLHDADAYSKRGDAYGEMGEYDKAIADYNKAIELDPNHALAYFNRAYAYGEIGEYKKAIADYSKTIELNPSDAQAYYNRGLDYHNKGEMPKAVSDLEKCIGLSTDAELTKAAQQDLLEIKNSP